MLVVLVAFAIVDIAASVKGLEKDTTTLVIYVCVLTFVVIIACYVWFFVLPRLLTSFTITSNVGAFDLQFA